MVKALYLNTSLKDSEKLSNTSALIQQSRQILKKQGVETEEIRIADYNIAFGMQQDKGNGDEWPKIFKKVIDASIVVIGAPIWIGEKSSLATLVMERLYASSAEMNEKGQSIYYNKVGAAIITGNEDGAKESARSILYGLQHIGFTIPPNVDAYWVGEAGPGPSYVEGGHNNQFTKKNTETLSYNVVHFAKLLDQRPIPAEGNLI